MSFNVSSSWYHLLDCKLRLGHILVIPTCLMKQKCLHAQIQKVLSERAQLLQRFVLVDEGREEQYPLKAGNHKPASELPLKWHFAGVPMMAQHYMLAWSCVNFHGIWTNIARKSYIFVFFQGGGVRTPAPLCIRTCCLSTN